MVNVTIVVPLYNEEEMFPLYVKKADELFKDTDKYSFDFIFVNDGSKDKTLELVKDQAASHDNYSYLSFSRNFGQDAAVVAGLNKAKGDVIVSMDCDLQDPPEIVFEMLKKYEQGYQLVQAQRIDRKADSWIQRNTSGAFYKIIDKVAKRQVVPPNTSQFKLYDRKAAMALTSLSEKIKLIRSETGFIGFKSCLVPFVRPERAAGKTKYNPHKLFNLAFHTITNSTLNPLDWPKNYGLFTGVINLICFIASLVFYILGRANVFASQYTDIFELLLIIFSIALCFSMICLFLGLISLYIKDIYANTQARPAYIIDEEFTSQKASKKQQGSAK